MKTLKQYLKSKQNMSLEFSLGVDSERVGTYPCNKKDDYLKKLLPLIDKYKEGKLSEKEMETIRDVFDEISSNDEEFYDVNTIHDLYVDGESYDVEDIKIIEKDFVANGVDSDYCIVSYFKWNDQTLLADIDTDEFDINKLSIECEKTLFTEGRSFQTINYEDDYLEYDADASESDTYHLKIYKKEGNEYVELVDFDFDEIFD